MQEQQQYLTDRTRILAYQRCPRQRFLAYHFQGTGIQRKGLSVPLVTGAMVHRGLELLLRGKPLNDALSDVVAEYDETVRLRGFAPDKLNASDANAMLHQIAYTYQEQKALIEALIRVFDIYGKKLLLREYEVVEIENEINVPLSENIIGMFRPDGILRHRETGQLFPLSFKTAASFSQDTHRAGAIDMQGKSETWAAQSAYPDDFFGGTQMLYLLKGKRDDDADRARKVQNSGLVRPWYSEKNKAYAYTYYFKNPQTGSRSNIGTTYKTFNAWERSFGTFGHGVAGWIEMLRQGRVQPALGNPFDNFIKMPAPYYRNQREIDSWRLQVTAQEEEVYARLRRLDDASDKGVALDALFPQHTDRCTDYGGCSFYGLCHQGEGIENFVARSPHHELEMETING